LFCAISEGGCCCGRAPLAAAYEWPVGWAAKPIWWREKSTAAATTKSIWERKRGAMMVKSSDTKLRTLPEIHQKPTKLSTK